MTTGFQCVDNIFFFISVVPFPVFGFKSELTVSLLLYRMIPNLPTPMHS